MLSLVIVGGGGRTGGLSPWSCCGHITTSASGCQAPFAIFCANTYIIYTNGLYTVSTEPERARRGRRRSRERLHQDGSGSDGSGARRVMRVYADKVGIIVLIWACIACIVGIRLLYRGRGKRKVGIDGQLDYIGSRYNGDKSCKCNNAPRRTRWSRASRDSASCISRAADGGSRQHSRPPPGSAAGAAVATPGRV